MPLFDGLLLAGTGLVLCIGIAIGAAVAFIVRCPNGRRR